jgi:hypothetical protein
MSWQQNEAAARASSFAWKPLDADQELGLGEEENAGMWLTYPGMKKR